MRPIESIDLDIGAKRGLRDVDRHAAVQVEFVTLEDRMLFDFDCDVQVAGRPAVCARLAFLRKP